MPKLLNRARHYSACTEEAYLAWIRPFLRFHPKRHPAHMGAAEVSAFRSHLATERDVAASTQNQACAALLFLHKGAPGQEWPWLDGVVRAA